MNLSTDQFFRVLGDQTRLRCLVLVHREGELCVCELQYALGLAQPKISRHLAVLREARVVADRRRGQWIHYRLHPELPDWAHTVLMAAAQGVEGTEPYAADRAALAEMPNRPGSPCCA